MYILEGNIGAGKSTFITLLGQYMPNIKLVLEPIHTWKKEIYGQSLLKNFYEQPKRWAYTFELLTLQNRIKEHLIEQKNIQPKIIERSIYSGFYCFAQNSYEQGFITSLEWYLYQEWFKLLARKCDAPQGFIYLRTAPEISYQRIIKRNRNAETNIPLEYVQQIHKKHEQYLIEKKDIFPELKKVPVLVLNCNEEFETNSLFFDKLVNQIEAFMQRTSKNIHASSPVQMQTH